MKLSTAISAAAMITAAGAAHAQSYFRVIIPGQAFSMSADGQWITGHVRDGSNNAYIYNSTTAIAEPIVTGLIKPSGLPTPSNDGNRVVGNFQDNGVSVPGVWTRGVGWTAIAPTPDAFNQGGSLGSGYGISGDGTTTSGFFWSSAPGIQADAFDSQTGSTAALPNSGGFGGGRGTVINADGSIIAGFDQHPVNGYRRAAVWTNGVLEVLTPDSYGDLKGMNSIGDIVVGKGDKGLNQWNMKWTFDGSSWVATDLGFVSSHTAMNQGQAALDVSNDGSICVGVAYGGGSVPVGWIWTETTGLIEAEDYFIGYGLDLDGFEIDSVNAISDDGTILAGYGWDPVGQFSTGWVVRMDVPAPACTPADVTTQGAGIGDPGFGVPDHAITGSDIQHYVNAWIVSDLDIADVTTQGAAEGHPLYGVPEGEVTGADINWYVNLWVAGCP